MQAVTPLHDVEQWVRGSGLEIVLLVLGSILLVRFAGFVRDRVVERIGRGTGEGAVVQSEATKHRRALAQILTWVATVLIWTVAIALILHRFGIPFASLAAPLAAGGVALGLGAQRLVQDLISGSFIIAERQYGFGDLVRIASTTETDGAIGTVEDLTLRITRLRTANGERVIIPNGQIVQVTNLSSEWARAVVDVPVPIGTDIVRVRELLHEVGEATYEDPELQPLLLNAPDVLGVESFDEGSVNIRMVARTLPGKQFEVARELRARVSETLQRERIAAAPAETAAPPSEDV